MLDVISLLIGLTIGLLICYWYLSPHDTFSKMMVIGCTILGLSILFTFYYVYTGQSCSAANQIVLMPINRQF